MNDLGSRENQQESIFKVYKDKLINFIGGKKAPITNKSVAHQPQNQPQNQTNNTTRPATTLQNLTESPKPPNNHFKPTAGQSPRAKNISKSFSGGKSNLLIKSIIIILITIFVGYFAVNYQAIALKFNYYYEVSIEKQKWSELHRVELQKAKTTSQKLDENFLYIPALGIQAPVIWGVEDKDINAAMSSGLVHYLSSAAPDSATGNIFIIGSTSGPIWSGSDYKTVFTLLNKIKLDDVVTIIYNNKIYSYRVAEMGSSSNSKITIAPGDDKEDSILNLLARYPIGINWSTFQVQAKLFKIESNILQSIDDKINQLPETVSQIELPPIEVTPTPAATPIPTDNKIPNPDLLPLHFLPSV